MPHDVTFNWWPPGEPNLDGLPAFLAPFKEAIRDLCQAAWWDGFRTGLGLAAVVLIVLYLLANHRARQQ